MESLLTWFQILDLSLRANAFGKGMSPFILFLSYE